MSDGDDLNNREEEIGINFKYILVVELIGLGDRMDMGREREELGWILSFSFE